MKSIKESIIGRRGSAARQYFIVWPAIRDIDLLYSRFPDHVEHDTNYYKWFLLSYEELLSVFDELEWVYDKKGNSASCTNIYKVEDPQYSMEDFKKDIHNKGYTRILRSKHIREITPEEYTQFK